MPEVRQLTFAARLKKDVPSSTKQSKKICRTQTPKVQRGRQTLSYVGRPSLFILYFIHKFFGRLTPFEPQPIAQQFFLAQQQYCTNEQANYSDISLFLYGQSLNVLGPTYDSMHIDFIKGQNTRKANDDNHDNKKRNKQITIARRNTIVIKRRTSKSQSQAEHTCKKQPSITR